MAARRHAAPGFAPGLEILALAGGGAVTVGVAANFGVIAAIAGLLAVAAAWYLYRRPIVAGLLLIAVVPAASGIRRGLPIPGLRMTELLILGLSTLVIIGSGRRAVARWGAVDYWALSYVIATAVIGYGNLFGRGEQPTFDEIGTLIGPLQFFLLYRAVAITMQTEDVRRAAVRYMLVAAVPVALLSLSQHFNVPTVDRFILAITDVDLRSDTFVYQQLPERPTGPFPHWQILGAYLTGAVVLSGALLLHRQYVMRPRLQVAVFVVLSLSLVATVTFTTILGAIAGLVLIGRWSQRGRTVAICLAALTLLSAPLVGPLFAQRVAEQTTVATSSSRPSWVPQTLEFRYNVWVEEYLPTAAKYIETGFGPSLPTELTFEYPESLYLTLLLRGGLPLLLIFIGFSIAVYRRTKRERVRVTSIDRVITDSVAALTLVLVAMHFVEPYFTTTGLPHMYWVLIGLGTAATAASRHTQGTPAPKSH